MLILKSFWNEVKTARTNAEKTYDEVSDVLVSSIKTIDKESAIYDTMEFSFRIRMSKLIEYRIIASRLFSIKKINFLIDEMNNLRDSWINKLAYYNR